MTATRRASRRALLALACGGLTLGSLAATGCREGGDAAAESASSAASDDAERSERNADEAASASADDEAASTSADDEAGEPANGDASGSAGERPGEPDLPGVARVDPALEEELRAEAERKREADVYEPHVEHRDDDGTPSYVNRLIRSSSPYLLQHAHNPVNWFAWGDAPFERAERLDRPVLLSVGYSTCHWCHVMKRESFEDEEIASYLNEAYVAIKVDREVRPAVDSLYMDAVRMLSGGGGWPMTVLMTPDREPFFGGTYFPPRDGDRGARKGFLTILKEMKADYEDDRDKLLAEAERVSRRIRASAQPGRPGDVPGPEAIAKTVQRLAQRYDPRWGGFGGQQKFPRPSRLELLLRYHRRTGDERALEMVVDTLEHMAAGGFHDHVGGGFHRYTVDRRWLVPHFEKMLYDNAQLASLYVAGWRVTGRERFRRIAERTLDYVARDMTHPGGGFYSATNAESRIPGREELEEGRFFTWTPEEIREVLSPERARLAIDAYDVTDDGEVEGRNVLHRPDPLETVAERHDTSPEALRDELDAIRDALRKAREERPHPHLDDKVVTSWNGLMISAFARAGHALDRADYRRRAREAASFVLERLRGDDGRLRRMFKNDAARKPAYLADYAFVIRGLLDLWESHHDLRWLEAARELEQVADAHYRDEEDGGYFRTADDHAELLAREKPGRDGAVPSGNSVMATSLLRLHEITGEARYRKRAESCFEAFSRRLRGPGGGTTKMLSALDAYLDRPLQVILVEPEGADAEAAAPLARRIRRSYLPNRMLVRTREGEALERLAETIPLVAKKVARDGKPTAYVCREGTCKRPTSDPAVLAEQLADADPLYDNRNPEPLPEPGSDEPEPWTYDEEQNRHWHPGHRHWHEGPPPEEHR